LLTKYRPVNKKQERGEKKEIKEGREREEGQAEKTDYDGKRNFEVYVHKSMYVV